MIRYVLFHLLISLAGEEVCSAWFWNLFFALSKSACGGLVRRVRHFVQPWECPFLPVNNGVQVSMMKMRKLYYYQVWLVYCFVGLSSLISQVSFTLKVQGMASRFGEILGTIFNDIIGSKKLHIVINSRGNFQQNMSNL